MAKKLVQPFFDARGRLLLERRGLPRELGSTLATDAYHFLRTTTWTRIVLLFAALYLGANLAFAATLWFGPGKVANADGFLEYFWFSVQTLATIGYGGFTPDNTFSHVIVTIESFFGLGLTALATGVFFSRFATPSARIIFSKVALVTTYEGQRVLMFRVANARATAIVEATCKLYLSRDEVTRSGERVRRIYDLELRRSVSPIFALSWTVYHDLDDKSPLHGLTPENMAAGSMNIVVTFQGIDDTLAATVHTRYAYNPEDLEFDRKFVDILKTDANKGVRYLDFEDFHTTEVLPAETPALTSVGLASPG